VIRAKISRWKAPFLLVSLLLALSMAIAACGGDDDEGGDSAATTESPAAETTAAEEPKEPTKIRLAMVPAATLLPAMVAIDQGIFEKHGLDVEHTFVQNLATLPGAMGRQFDIGASTSLDVMKAQEEGIDIVLVASGAKDGPGVEITGAMTKPDSGINSAKDLEGKTMGAVAPGGGNIHPATLFWMKREGADPEKVRFVEVPHPNQFDQLKAGTVDATQSLEPFKGRMKRELKAKVLADPVRIVMEEAGLEEIDFLSFMAEGKWAKENPDVLQAFVDAHNEAAEFITQNEDEARAIFQKMTEVPPEVVKTIPFPLYKTTLGQKQLDAWAAVLVELGQVPKDYKPDVNKLVVTPADNIDG
jgi:NitT/TauT family transport system substrate-binding protein